MANYNSYAPRTPVFGTTGNYATVNDPYVSTVPPIPNSMFSPDALWANGALNQPGSVVRIFDNSSTPRPIVLRYVRYNPTAHVALSASNVPGLVYWKDETFTVVTPTLSEAVGGSGTANNAAGCLLNVNVTDGNWTWILTGGYLAAVVSPALVAVGDNLVGGSATALALTRAASGVALTVMAAAVALSAVASSKADTCWLLDSI